MNFKVFRQSVVLWVTDYSADYYFVQEMLSNFDENESWMLLCCKTFPRTNSTSSYSPTLQSLKQCVQKIKLFLSFVASFHQLQSTLLFLSEVQWIMDPSFYSPQPIAKTHAAVCYCRAHGTIAQGYHETSYGPPSPITRQLIQQHPQAVVIQHGLETTLVPCQVVYHHHQPVYGYMAHNTLDGATAIARQRRSQSHSCQDPRCCQSPSSQQPQPQAKNRHQKSMKSRKSKSSKNAAAANAYKSAPSSPVGTPKRLVNMVQATSATPSTTPKKSLPLNPQWITAFPTIETPSESGYPALKTTMTGCCGKRQMSSVAKRRQRSNSYSALDSTSDDGQVDYDEHTAGKGGAGLPKRQVSNYFL